MIRHFHFTDKLKLHLRKQAKLRAYLLAARERWTPLQKADICFALARGFVTTPELVAAHGLSEDEIADWLAAYASGGAAGLKQPARRAAA